MGKPFSWDPSTWSPSKPKKKKSAITWQSLLGRSPKLVMDAKSQKGVKWEALFGRPSKQAKDANM